MAYHLYLEKGYPIATGVIEGTCRYLVKDRMEITGARWGLQGAEALLQLRAIECSGDFDEYWKFYEQKQYEKNYQCLYKNPDVLRPKKAHYSTVSSPNPKKYFVHVLDGHSPQRSHQSRLKPQW
jgi:hypothetical protein